MAFWQVSEGITKVMPSIANKYFRIARHAPSVCGMSLITHLRHVHLAVPDFERQLAFYTRTWGPDHGRQRPGHRLPRRRGLA